MTRLRLALLAVPWLVASLGVSALGATCRDVQFPDTVTVGSSPLVLNGLGIRKATMLKVNVYVAGLYLPNKQSAPGPILGSDGPWQLVLRFVRDVGASDIRGAFQEGFEQTAGNNLAALRPRIDAFNAQIPDLKTGQALTFAHASGAGVALDVNGKAARPIDGADFASALLTIWLGAKPPNEDLKSGLLGGACQ